MIALEMFKQTYNVTEMTRVLFQLNLHGNKNHIKGLFKTIGSNVSSSFTINSNVASKNCHNC